MVDIVCFYYLYSNKAVSKNPRNPMVWVVLEQPRILGWKKGLLLNSRVVAWKFSGFQGRLGQIIFTGC